MFFHLRFWTMMSPWSPGWQGEWAWHHVLLQPPYRRPWHRARRGPFPLEWGCAEDVEDRAGAGIVPAAVS